MKKALLGILILAALVPATFFIAGAIAPEATARFAVNLERSASGLSEKSLQIPGFQIRYLEGGSGEPLILLHGFGANKDNWSRISKLLTPHYRVIAPDLPGFGESSKPADQKYRYTDQIPRIHAFAQALRLKQFHIGDNSMGGYFSAGVAAEYPEAVLSTWLLAPGGVHAAQPSEMARKIAAGEEVPLLAETPKDFDKIFGFVMTNPPWIPGFYKAVLAERAVAAYPLNKQIFEQIRNQSPALEDQVDGLATPTLIHWGDQDRVLHVSGAQVLAQVMPKAQVITLPQIGHMPMLEAPEQVAQDYIKFRRGLAGLPAE